MNTSDYERSEKQSTQHKISKKRHDLVIQIQLTIMVDGFLALSFLEFPLS